MSDARAISQEPRIIRLESPITGDSALVPRHLTVREAMSRPFLIEIEAFSKREDIDQDEILGKMIKATIKLPAHEIPERDFHGVVRSFTRLGDYERGFTGYRIEAVPRAWMFSRTADCRIYQNRTVQKIVEELFSENSGTGSPICQNLPSQPRVYCTQYMETDLDFMQRILDECGATYYFDHSGGQDQIKCVGGDGPFPTIPMTLTMSATNQQAPNHLTNWAAVGAMIPSKVEAFDHDQKYPRKDLKQTTTTKLAAAKADHWEMFIWSGGQDVVPGIDVARLAMETAEAMAETFTAIARNPNVFPGGKLAVKMGETGGGGTKQCLVQAVTHVAYDDTHLVSGASSGYQAEVRLSLAERPFHNPTPRSRPTMPGLMSALVTGPSGGEIHTDDLGRIKVRLLWDRKGPKDDQSSCWVRVMQPFAGAWGGTWFLPRVNDEVIVGFMNGNPDYPICVGSVYNMDGKPPFTLPGKKTQSGFLTRSTPQGQGSNILRVDDAKGSEEFYFHAEKDMNVVVENNRDVKVKADHTETIKNNRSATIETGNESLTVSGGNMTTKISAGSQTTDAMQSITLKVGGNSITIDQQGITIKGMMVSVQGSLSAEVKGGASLTLSGGVTKIN